MRQNSFNTRLLALLAWFVALCFAFPIIWMIVTAFKTERQAIAMPPLLVFHPVLSSFAAALNGTGYVNFALNSVIVSLGSTLLAIVIAFPAAYALAFRPGKGTQGILVWMLSTKMLPPVGALVPVYLIYRDVGLLDTRTGLIILNMLMNLPLVVWMLYSFFRDIPNAILEAAKVDGVSTRQQMIHLLLPLAAPGIASTALLCIIFAWNESFWAINLTAAHAGTLASFITRFSQPEGLFWAKLSAASVVTVAPVLIFGALTQRHLVRGLTFGAVK
ncbi:carbohydrate ABC transporter permease [Acidocella sp.]|uniref:carbohydrate ABC transporter permease n=1 Tax=Acidocella sp. TaxID=50710 RepID=UPI003D029A0E